MWQERNMFPHSLHSIFCVYRNKLEEQNVESIMFFFFKVNMHVTFNVLKSYNWRTKEEKQIYFMSIKETSDW